jgi:hypothetical protein
MTAPGTELGDGGHLVGRDPRTMSVAELGELGHQPMSAQAAIRLHCLDCCAGSPHEVRACMATKCPSWPFRMGSSPWKAKRQLSEAQRAALRERGRALGRQKAR